MDKDINPPSLSNMRNLFKNMVHPLLGADICFIGFARPTTGGYPAAAELQSRYIAMIYNNELSLPKNIDEVIRSDKLFYEK